MQIFLHFFESCLRPMIWHAICCMNVKSNFKRMKKILSLLLVVWMGVASVQATIVIVMDTTQALLNGAEIKTGKTVLRTSFDGRAEVTPEILTCCKRIVVTCEGYKKQQVKIDLNQKVQIVRLVESPVKKKENNPKGLRRDGGTRMLTASATPDDLADTRFYACVAEEAAVSMSAKTGGAASNNVKAGKLTAGEVNDFAKWSFWETYQQASVRHQKTWRIEPPHRFVVQVTNKNGYPFAARAVSLLDANGNTLFQAVTDNTGKAELWHKSVGNLKIRVDEQTKDAKEWSEGLNTFVLDEECDHTDAVDVVFVFDATGSMGDELRYLQAEMKDVIARASEATGGLQIRTGAVVYRDHGDDYITRISRLTDDIATTQAFIDKQYASGGGDYEEAVPEALMAAMNSAGWDDNARARIAFLVLDAPCHDDSATLALLHEQVLNAAALGVRVVPLVCSGLSESGEYLLRWMALTTNGTSFFLTDDSGIGHSHLKPQTDSLKVEHLNDMLVRTIVEFSYMPSCKGKWDETAKREDEGEFVPNPFDAKDLTEQELAEKDSPTTLYLLDVSGKLIYVYQGRLENAGDSQLSRLPIPLLSTGIYFVKAFYDGEWHTKKILVH